MKPDATNLATHPRRARALELALEGRTDSEIATELGTDRVTIWRWRTDPGFAAELRERHRERLTVLNERMLGIVPRALDVLCELMNDAAQPPMVRMRAAEALLDRAAWTGKAQERRIEEAIRLEVDSFLRLLVERLPDATVEEVVKVARQPWPETRPPPREPRQARIEVSFPEPEERVPA